MRNAVTCALALLAGTVVADAATGASGDPARELRSLHPDVAEYVRAVRVVSVTAAGGSLETIYSGLVRPGGTDPRAPDDLPGSGRGSRNDIVILPSAFEHGRSAAWLRLVLDHEYYHAKHLARGWRTPLVDFSDASANHAYYEATAWGYVLRRALDGAYGDLHESEIREVRATYRRHFEAIRAFILDRQPAAWTHYARFMPGADGTDVVRAPLTR